MKFWLSRILPSDLQRQALDLLRSVKGTVLAVAFLL